MHTLYGFVGELSSLLSFDLFSSSHVLPTADGEWSSREPLVAAAHGSGKDGPGEHAAA